MTGSRLRQSASDTNGNPDFGITERTLQEVGNEDLQPRCKGQTIRHNPGIWNPQSERISSSAGSRGRQAAPQVAECGTFSHHDRLFPVPRSGCYIAIESPKRDH